MRLGIITLQTENELGFLAYSFRLENSANKWKLREK